MGANPWQYTELTTEDVSLMIIAEIINCTIVSENTKERTLWLVAICTWIPGDAAQLETIIAPDRNIKTVAKAKQWTFVYCLI